MTNICLLVRDRPRLTEQTLRTLFQNTPKDQFNLTIVDDGSWPETAEIIKRYSNYENVEVVTFRKPVGIVGFLRNVGAATSERVFGRGEWLVFLDNDVAVESRWLDRMIEAMQRANLGDEVHQYISVLGGYRHPFHGINRLWGDDAYIEETDAVAGYSMLMRWTTFDKYGPFVQNQKGIGASEDWDFCQRIGGKVGYINPPVLSHCGITGSNGKPAVGAEHFRRIPGLVYG